MGGSLEYFKGSLGWLCSILNSKYTEGPEYETFLHRSSELSLLEIKIKHEPEAGTRRRWNMMESRNEIRSDIFVQNVLFVGSHLILDRQRDQ